MIARFLFCVLMVIVVFVVTAADKVRDWFDRLRV